jgi:tetratricopeptide (TPR) repeat protein
MSPEQAQGQETDQRSDVFSLGVIMFEIFSGELPFRGENSLAVLHQIVNVTAPGLRQQRSGIPVALDRIVAKALERDRAERYQSAADLATDLRTLRRELLFGSSTQRSSLETVAIGTAPTRRRRGPSLQRALGIAAAFVVLGLGAWLGWPSVRARTVSWFRAQSLPAEKRLAILPFRNIGGNSKDQAFVDGLREVVINKLTRLEGPVGALVVVVSPDEVRVKEISTAADAWKRLGANLVMTGSVVTAGQQPQLIVNLEDPQTLTVLRSETIDASHSDLMAQSENLVRMLELGLNDQTRQTLQAGDSHNPDAVRYYVEGLGYLLRFDRVENLDLSAAAFRDAISKDPNYTLAWAGLAQALGEKYKIQKDPAVLAQAADSGGRALHLNGKLAAVHITVGEIQLAQGEYVAAAQELQAALKLEVANAKAFHILGDAYQAMGKYEEAEATYKKAIELRPGDAAGYYYLGTFYFRREQLPAAELSFRRAVELAPDSYLALSNLGGVYLRMGRYSEAVDEFVKSVSIAPSARAYGNLGAAYYYLKSYAEAVPPYQRAVDISPKESANWGNLADAYRWTPALREQAPAAFRRAIQLLQQEIKVDPRNPRLHARLAMYHAAVGDRAPALAEIADALRLDPSQAYVQYRAGLVYEETGDRENALNHIELALRAGEPRAEILAAPPLERLRKDSRFARMAGPQP